MTDGSSPAADALAGKLAADRTASRLWEGDVSLFAPARTDTDVASAIRARLGWLTAPANADDHSKAASKLAGQVRRAHLTEVYLLGMGGSSLSAEVLRDALEPAGDGCRLTVLDTTDERRIRQVTDALTPTKSLFIVASKSGSTVEVTALAEHFWNVMTEAVGKKAGKHFVAITDHESPLVAMATERKFRQTLINPADIGGRFAALSLFGLVPAALLGHDLEALVSDAREMADRCRADQADNPGLALGAFLAAQALSGRDKLTLLLPPKLAALGAWIEQLVAESTGKLGRGILPVVGEPLGAPVDYGNDRMFVVVETSDSSDLEATARLLEAGGHAVLRIRTSQSALGAEWFRWEFATAVAGVALDVNPFDEPDVRAAKRHTEAQLDALRQTGSFRFDPPYEQKRGYLRREHRPAASPGAPPAPTGRFLALLDYLPEDWRRPTIVERLRGAIRRRTRMATTHGTGPRYLHSTGQFHKGGPNTGLFLMLTAADGRTTAVPGTDYTFSTLKLAQALGDFDALVAANREVIHYHVDDPTADFSATLERILDQLKT